MSTSPPPTEVPVLIVGGSLVGLTLAALLAQYGVKDCLTVERHESTAIHPRATLMMPHTMRIFKELGLYDIMIEESRKYYDEETCIITVESLAGKFLKSWMRDVNEGIENVSPTRRVFLTQQALEPILRSKCSELDAELRFSTEMVSFTQDSTGVIAQLKDHATNSTYSVKARYMIACDGFRSRIRSALQIPTHGPGLLSRALTIYFSVIDKEKLAKLPNAKYAGVIYASNPKIRAFFRFDKEKNESFLVINSVGEPGTEESRFPADTVTQEKAEEYLKAAIGVDDIAFKIHQITNWDAIADVPERIQEGNVFLAGDAAHRMPPTGGFGGNTGIQDTYNLAWKLALVYKGQAGQELLETYQEERLPVTKMTVENVYTHYVERTEPGLAYLKEQHSIKEVPIDQLELGYRYLHSRALPEPADDSPTEDPATSVVKAGSIAHHVLVSTLDGTQKEVPISSLFAKGGFTVFIGPEGDIWQDSVNNIIKFNSKLPPVRIVKLRYDSSSVFAQRYGVDEGGMVLVRPDGFVAEVITNAPWAPFLDSVIAGLLKRILCLEGSLERIKEGSDIGMPLEGRMRKMVV